MLMKKLTHDFLFVIHILQGWWSSYNEEETKEEIKRCSKIKKREIKRGHALRM